MNSPQVIGITGGIGSGKSTLSKYLRTEGYLVYDSDLVAKHLQNENPKIRKQLVDLFGEKVYSKQGLNRQILAQLVFGNKELLSKLNSIVHPVVETDFKNWIKIHLNQKFLFIESAILFESKFNQLVDKVIVITASEEVRIFRVMKRDGITAEQVKARMSNQVSEDTKMSKADFIIHSDDNMSLVDKMHKILQELNK